MRILLVNHDFLPNHPSGTEIYTCQLGVELRRRGHDVHVFTTEKDVSRPHLSLARRTYAGLPVHELTHNLFYDDFRETWDDPAAAARFGQVLDELRPDVVHFMHLLYLGVGCVEEAQRREIPVVYTLHDYWPQCARFGQRIHANGSICHVIEFERCGDCLARFKFRQTPLERRVSGALATLRGATGLDLAPLARKAAAFAEARRKDEPPASASASATAPHPDAPRFAAAARERDAELRARLVAAVDRFVAPSRFLYERYLEWGLAPEHIVQSRAGIDVAPFAGFERTQSERLRVAYLGTLAPHKGVHVLLEAWSRIAPAQRANAALTVYGPRAHNPAYVARLDELARAAGATLAGGVPAERVPATLAHVDLLVMPSVWYENSPLVILEALATRTPLVVSDLGGMAELVEEDRHGWRFPTGDAAALAELLATILAEPARLERLYREGSPVKPIETDATELLALYADLGA